MPPSGSLLLLDELLSPPPHRHRTLPNDASDDDVDDDSFTDSEASPPPPPPPPPSSPTKSCMSRSSAMSSIKSSSNSSNISSSNSDDDDDDESCSSSNDSSAAAFGFGFNYYPSASTTTRRTPRKRVAFNTREPADVCEIIHLSEYTDEERVAVWYNGYDVRSFKRDRRETARRIEGRRQAIATAIKARNNNNCQSASTFSSPSYTTGPYHHRRSHHTNNDSPDTPKQSIAGLCHMMQRGHDGGDHEEVGSDTDDELYYIRGVEGLTESGGRLRTAFIVNGINAVLNEQDLQDQDAKCNPEKLAQVYRSRTQPSLRIAQERALVDQQEAQRLHREDEAKHHTNNKKIDDDASDGINNQLETMTTIDLNATRIQESNFQMTLTAVK